MKQERRAVYVRLEGLKEYKRVIVLAHPGVIYINLCADKDANMDLIVPELAA